MTNHVNCHQVTHLTIITITKEEQELLDLGMRHNIQQTIEAYWTNLILETEHPIRLLDPRIQDAYRLMATRKLKQIRNTNHNTNNTQFFYFYFYFYFSPRMLQSVHGDIQWQ